MSSSTNTNEEMLYNKKDWSSFANFHEVVTTNIKLEWNLDFEKQVISGSVEHLVKVLADGTTEVNFDSKNIHFEGDVLINNEKTPHTLGDDNAVLGRKVSVFIPQDLRKQDTVFSVKFNYWIDSNASAVQWLEPSATKGGKLPYIFTQCQAIHARSLLPCMDSPGVKTPYSARVTAPAWCTVLMSALAVTYATAEETAFAAAAEAKGQRVFNWSQPVPTSAYLIALAGGNLASLDVSERVRIWAEPEIVEAAHNEFLETEEFVVAAEAITGCPYQWKRYDVVCLPPSFPYGGMENPCLTFATPTLLAGDRSLADVIAHEIAHSWTGNLVTNHVWDHFWLNEGWTVWLERKITSRVKRNEEVGRLSAEIGFVHLQESVEQLGHDSPFTQLVWPLRGEDPDDAFSSVPYEKGFNLLTYLESLVGRENFEAFAKSYIQEFKFKTVTTGEFRDHFVEFITSRLSPASESAAVETPEKKKKNKKKGKKTDASPTDSTNTVVNEANQRILRAVEELNWDDLFLTKDMPKYTNDFKNSLSLAAKVLANFWIEIYKDGNSGTSKNFTPAKTDTIGWSSQQLCLFLDSLLELSIKSPLPVAALEKMADLYGFSKSKNAEICLRWQQLGLKAGASWIIPQVVEFITSNGRMKFVRPLYRALRTSNVGGRIANEVFQKHKMMYHPIARKMLETDLNRLNEADKTSASVVTSPEITQEVVENNYVAVTTPTRAAPAAAEPAPTNTVSPAVSTSTTPVKAPVVEEKPKPTVTPPPAPVESVKTETKPVVEEKPKEEPKPAPVPAPAPVVVEKKVVVEEKPKEEPKPAPAPAPAPVPTPAPAAPVTNSTKAAPAKKVEDQQVANYRRNTFYALVAVGTSLAAFLLIRNWRR